MSLESEYCTLISSDNFTFTITRAAACVSGTLKSLLSSNFSESATGVVRLESIEGVLLEKVCEYLYYHLRWKDEKEVPEFVIEPELALNLLVAADFLDGSYTCHGRQELLLIFEQFRFPSDYTWRHLYRDEHYNHRETMSGWKNGNIKTIRS